MNNKSRRDVPLLSRFSAFARICVVFGAAVVTFLSLFAIEHYLVGSRRGFEPITVAIGAEKQAQHESADGTSALGNQMIAILERVRFSRLENEFVEARDLLEQAIVLADQVRIAMQHRVYAATELYESQGIRFPSLAAQANDVAFRDVLEAGIAESTALLADSNVAFTIDPQAAVSKLSAARTDLVSLYQPDGPYPNPHNFPAFWLAGLPNGDPRNLPWGRTQFVGPESVQFSYSSDSAAALSGRLFLGTRLVGNRGGAMSDHVLDLMQLRCEGPNELDWFDDLEYVAGHCLPNAQRVIVGYRMGRFSFSAGGAHFGYYDYDTGDFESLKIGLLAGPFTCQRIQQQSYDGVFSAIPFISGNQNLNRDVNGFIVIDRMAGCDADFDEMALPTPGNFTKAWHLDPRSGQPIPAP